MSGDVSYCALCLADDPVALFCARCQRRVRRGVAVAALVALFLLAKLAGA